MPVNIPEQQGAESGHLLPAPHVGMAAKTGVEIRAAMATTCKYRSMMAVTM
jgi:hypothetical protein